MSKKITCTRCLGKGFIDKKDIKRLSRGLNRVSEWEENSDCKFCKGEGTITEKFASKHNPDSGEFPNVQNYSGLVDFLELTAEEKNERFTEAMGKVGGDINFDKEDELTTNSKSKTIFWTAFFSVTITLIIVLYSNLNESGVSNISTFFNKMTLVLTLLSMPATIIYRLMFGKIDREKDYDFYYLFAIFSFALFLYVMTEILKIFIPKSLILVLVSLISSILPTIVFLRWMYKPKSNQNKKNSL